jgi:hypothetical protein
VIVNISKGTIIRARQQENITSLPGKRSWEKAKPARMDVKVAMATQEMVTIRELKKYRTKGTVSVTYIKFSSLNAEGIQVGGVVATSAGVLKDELIIQK